MNISNYASSTYFHVGTGGKMGQIPFLGILAKNQERVFDLHPDVSWLKLIKWNNSHNHLQYIWNIQYKSQIY